MQQRKINSKKCPAKHNKIAIIRRGLTIIASPLHIQFLKLFSSAKYPQQEQENIDKVKV